jgi:hypothetical protein
VNATQIESAAQARRDANAIFAELGRQIVGVVQHVVVAPNGEEPTFEIHPGHAAGNLTEIRVAWRDGGRRRLPAGEDGHDREESNTAEEGAHSNQPG